MGGNEIDRVVARARELLPRALLRSAFYRLNDPSASNTARFGRLQTNVVDCDCSSIEGCDPAYACDGICAG